MEHAFGIAALWFGLALIATFLASLLRVSIALVEILMGIAASSFLQEAMGRDVLSADEPWLKFLSSTGAVLLTFLAGAELDPASMRKALREVSVVGMLGFLAPFLGCAAVARFLLGWSADASWLAGIALSTTSMAVVYAVMLETGLNQTAFGKGVLGSCFVNDLGTVVALGLIFSPFTIRTVIFLVGTAVAIVLLPVVTPRLVNHYANRTASFRTKWVLFLLFSLGALALWAGSEAVLPAYVVGMVLSAVLGRDPAFLRRLRTLAIGFLTPVYFLRAGSLVSVGALWAAPAVFVLLLAGKVLSKILGLYPVIGRFRSQREERWYYTLLMSTGLTFGTISALFGLTHGIVDREQYSHLVAVVIASAVIPTLIANAFFLPRHLLPRAPVPVTIRDPWHPAGRPDPGPEPKEEG